MHYSFNIFALCALAGWLCGVLARRITRVPAFLDDGI